MSPEQWEADLVMRAEELVARLKRGEKTTENTVQFIKVLMGQSLLAFAEQAPRTYGLSAAADALDFIADDFARRLHEAAEVIRKSDTRGGVA